MSSVPRQNVKLFPKVKLKFNPNPVFDKLYRTAKPGIVYD